MIRKFGIEIEQTRANAMESQISSTRSKLPEKSVPNTILSGIGFKKPESSPVINPEPTKVSAIDLIKTEDLTPLPYDYRSVITKRGSSIPPAAQVKSEDTFTGSVYRQPPNPFLGYDSGNDLSRPIVNEIKHFDDSGSS